jgi:hypothetical protein
MDLWSQGGEATSPDQVAMGGWDRAGRQETPGPTTLPRCARFRGYAPTVFGAKTKTVRIQTYTKIAKHAKEVLLTEVGSLATFAALV